MNLFSKLYEEVLTEAPVQLGFGDNFKEEETSKTIYRIIQLKKLNKQEGGFCTWQPKIKEFALKSSDNMAVALIFPIATQMQHWGEVNKHFVDLITHLRANGNLKFSRDEREQVEWKGMAFAGRVGIEYIWRTRHILFRFLKPLVESGESFKIYEFLATRIPNLGTVKAAFAVQLLTGKMGCIDSINARFLNIPPELLDAQTGKIVSSVKHFVNKKTKQLSERGLTVLKRYEEFLKTVKRYNGDDVSRQLWDVWCSVVGIRAITAGERQSRFGFDAGSYSGEIPMYKNSPSMQTLKHKLLKLVKDGGGSIQFNPDGTVESMDDKAVKIMSNSVSKDHYSLMFKAMEIPQSKVKQLNQTYMNLNKQPSLFEAIAPTKAKKKETLDELRAIMIKLMDSNR